MLPIVCICSRLSQKKKKRIVIELSKTSSSLFQHVCVDVIYHQYMRDKKCQLPFECENNITLLSRSGSSNIIIICLLISHRLLSFTHHIRYILVWFWSRPSFLSAIASCNMFACMYVCVRSRSFPPFSMVLFCLIAIEWRRAVMVIHAYIVVFFL